MALVSRHDSALIAVSRKMSCNVLRLRWVQVLTAPLSQELSYSMMITLSPYLDLVTQRPIGNMPAYLHSTDISSLSINNTAWLKITLVVSRQTDSKRMGMGTRAHLERRGRRFRRLRRRRWRVHTLGSWLSRRADRRPPVHAGAGGSVIAAGIWIRWPAKHCHHQPQSPCMPGKPARHQTHCLGSQPCDGASSFRDNARQSATEIEGYR